MSITEPLSEKEIKEVHTEDEEDEASNEEDEASACFIYLQGLDNYEWSEIKNEFADGYNSIQERVETFIAKNESRLSMEKRQNLFNLVEKVQSKIVKLDTKFTQLIDMLNELSNEVAVAKKHEKASDEESSRKRMKTE